MATQIIVWVLLAAACANWPIPQSHPAASFRPRRGTSAHGPPASLRWPSLLSLSSAARPENNPSHSVQIPHGTVLSSAQEPRPLPPKADVPIHNRQAMRSSDSNVSARLL